MGFGIKKHLLSYQKASYAEEPGNTGIEFSQELIDCSLGTNPFGYSKLIDESDKSFLGNYIINKYPEVLYSELKKELAEYWRDIAELKDTNIRVGNGSVGILERINRIFIDEGSSVLGYCPQFSDYMMDVESRGGRYDYVLLKAEKSFEFDDKELLSAVKPEHKLIYIDNPNNPTGQAIPISILDNIIKEARKMDICVIIDEAYGDFMPKENSAVALINKYDNLLIAKSFSKGFGLAGLRIGYLVAGEELMGYYSKVDIPFTVPSIGQHLACLALKDGAFISSCRESISKVKERIVKSCSKIKVLKTDMEIPIMVLGHPDEKVDLYLEFAKRGVLTEPGKYFIGLGKNYVRLRVPTEAEKVVEVIKEIEEAS